MSNKTVYLDMAGDFIHPGIINIIKKAAEYGDILVGLSTDESLTKHRRLPILNYEQRKAVVEQLRGVTRVVPQEDWSCISHCKLL